MGAHDGKVSDGMPRTAKRCIQTFEERTSGYSGVQVVCGAEWCVCCVDLAVDTHRLVDEKQVSYVARPLHYRSLCVVAAAT